ncbi:MAG: hypothetical protein IT170_17935 [Bryobacterales bacterium]|nr:hypothetical protein [Bryobacterales bacterium]
MQYRIFRPLAILALAALLALALGAQTIIAPTQIPGLSIGEFLSSRPPRTLQFALRFMF